MSHSRRLVVRSWIAALIGALLSVAGLACGDSAHDAGPISAAGRPTSDAGSGSCGISTCAALHAPCGVSQDTCGNAVHCGTCRFASEPIMAQPRFFQTALGPDGTPSVAYLDGIGTVTVTQWDASGTRENTTVPASISSLDFAIGSDGTRWISLGDGSMVWVAHAAAGAMWSTELAATASSSALAVSADGTPYLAYAGALAGKEGLFVAHRTGDTWDAEFAGVASAHSAAVGIAVAGSVPMVVWNVPGNRTVMFAQRDAGGWTQSTAAMGVDVDTHTQIEMTVDARGNPAFVLADVDVSVYFRRDAAWQSTGASRVSGASATLAFAPSGDLWYAWVGGDGVFIADVDLATLTTARQRVHRTCRTNSSIGLAFDGAGSVEVIDACASTLDLHRAEGLFGADYEAACSEIASALCAQACSCTGTANCCWLYGNGGNWCSGALGSCGYPLALNMCGDLATDQATVLTCRDALSQTACGQTGSTKGAVLPPACASLY